MGRSSRSEAWANDMLALGVSKVRSRHATQRAPVKPSRAASVFPLVAGLSLAAIIGALLSL